MRHILLFVAACALLILARFPGGALVALAVLMQMALLIHNFTLTAPAQIGVLKLFAVSVPLFFFWGGIHSFLGVYLNEGQFLFLIMAAVVSVAITAAVSFQIVFSYLFLEKNNFQVVATLQDAFNSLRDRKSEYFRIVGLMFVFSLIPFFLETDWKLVFAVMATHLYLNRHRLKTALASF